jgi:hypothetical protein
MFGFALRSFSCFSLCLFRVTFRGLLVMAAEFQLADAAATHDSSRPQFAQTNISFSQRRRAPID